MPMTFFEMAVRLVWPGYRCMYQILRAKLMKEVRAMPRVPCLLDVGGRRSSYTAGVPARITITDLPREGDLQRKLKLGMDDEMISETMARRSNIERFLFDDMTATRLPARSFDIVSAVEVLEHVQEDRLFVLNVARTLRTDGVFVMTTPNGEFVANRNPDHKRHYTGADLRRVLESTFREVEIEYGEVTGWSRRWGMGGLSRTNPLRAGKAFVGNLINYWLSRRKRIRSQGRRTHNLFAVAREPIRIGD